MANWAIIENDIIINRIVADTKEIAEQLTGLQAIDDEGWISIGFQKYENTWRPPYPTDGLEYTWDNEFNVWAPVNSIIIEG